MNNKNLILVVLGAAVILAIGMAVFAVLRNRQSATNTQGQTTGQIAIINEDTEAGNGEPAKGNRAICGDGICVESESVDICWSDCVDFGSFSDIYLTNLSDSQVEVTWKTSKPMTSGVDYGISESYELGSVSDSQLLTDHRLLVVGLSDGNYSFRVRGTDEDGNEEAFSGLGMERYSSYRGVIKNVFICSKNKTNQSTFFRK